jgi:exodeoxyribonuclease VII small subunit
MATTERSETTATGEPARPVGELTFDEALAELQRTIAELETGGQPLERTLALHERGAALLEHCETLLRSAELRMRQLVSKGGELRTVDVAADRPIEET